MRICTFIALCTLFGGAVSFAEECEVSCDKLNLHRQQVSLGFEGAHLTRKKSQGTKQHGTTWGARLEWERFRRYGWYLGAEGFFWNSKPSGHTGTGIAMRSRLKEAGIEGRFGYTFQCKTGWKPSITPFFGIGGYEEKNYFTSPSPLHLHYKTSYAYGSFGILTAIYPIDPLMIGLNIKARYPFSIKCRVSNDPEKDSVHQKVAERMQYRVELPVSYRMGCVALMVEPFYESRIYGSHPNYPFNFIKTKFTYWGGQLAVQYWW
jgi:hypothetical protein